MKAKLTYWIDNNGPYPVVIWESIGCILVLARIGQHKPIWRFRVNN